MQKLFSSAITRPLCFAELREKLLNRGYPSGLINRGFQKARAQHFKKLKPSIEKAAKKVENVQLLVNNNNRHHPALAVAKGLFNQLTTQLDRPWRCQVAYRRDKNILEYVGKGRKCHVPNSARFNSARCLNCKYCDRMDLNIHLDAPRGKSYDIPKKNITCRSTGAVYRIQCGCGQSYIGQTSRRITDRIAEHARKFEKTANGTDNDNGAGKERKRFYKHMAECPNSDFWKWCVLDLVKNAERFGLQAREREFIKLFRPSLNTQHV